MRKHDRRQNEDRRQRKGFEYKQNQPRPQLDQKGIPRRIGPYPARPPREDIQVTADTAIPPLPGKAEMLGKPNWEAEYKKEFEKYEEELKKLNNEKVRVWKNVG